MSAGARTPSSAPEAVVVFHDAECGGYGADLALWGELAGLHSGDRPIVELGAGTGRVALPLAAAGFRVLAVERDPLLADELRRRAAAAARPAVEVLEADARELEPPAEPAGLALATMQFMQLLDRGDRARVLGRVSAALVPGGLFAAALLDESLPLSSGEPEPLPDVREVDGWVHSSLPLEVRVEGEAIEIVRLRQLVSPAGELTEAPHTIRLYRVGAEQLAAEAAPFGLRLTGAERIGQTDDHVASIALLLERRDD